MSNTRPSLIHAAIGYRVLAVYKVGQRDIKEDRARRREEKRDRIDWEDWILLLLRPNKQKEEEWEKRKKKVFAWHTHKCH